MEEIVSIGFTEEEFDKIVQYMDHVKATTVQDAIMNAISIALDGIDGPDLDKKTEWNPDCEGCNPEDSGECQLCRER